MNASLGYWYMFRIKKLTLLVFYNAAFYLENHIEDWVVESHMLKSTWIFIFENILLLALKSSNTAIYVLHLLTCYRAHVLQKVEFFKFLWFRYFGTKKHSETADFIFNSWSQSFRFRTILNYTKSTEKHWIVLSFLSL